MQTKNHTASDQIFAQVPADVRRLYHTARKERRQKAREVFKAMNADRLPTRKG